MQKKNSLVQSNFISNLYIVDELNNWLHFTLKNCLYGTVKLTRNADKSK